MPDYSKCIIYTIRTPNGLYVGSTCNFINRKYGHKSAIHNENNEKYNIKVTLVMVEIKKIKRNIIRNIKKKIKKNLLKKTDNIVN